MRYDTSQEVKVMAPGGFKPYRFADLGIYDPESKELVGLIQVGKTTSSGIPVMRETQAISDIWTSTDLAPGVWIEFAPYDDMMTKEVVI
jgi:hypothetical protein